MDRTDLFALGGIAVAAVAALIMLYLFSQSPGAKAREQEIANPTPPSHQAFLTTPYIKRHGPDELGVVCYHLYNESLSCLQVKPREDEK
jgi:hypothetical protein